MSGLFIASLFCASLRSYDKTFSISCIVTNVQLGLFKHLLFFCYSTLSSGLSSLSALAIEDVVKPNFKPLSERTITFIAKISGSLYCFLSCYNKLHESQKFS